MTAATVEESLAITEPGVVYDLDETAYHADPVPEGSLSASGARRLLPPSCPAIFKWWLDNPEPPNANLDLGSAAHQLVLGSGPEIVEVEYENWRTNAAKDAANHARARGAVPLLTHDVEQVRAMAAALRAHPVAGRLFNPERGMAEVSIFWRDEPTKVMRRARLDWLPTLSDARLVVTDYKTSTTADPAAFGRKATDYGYHIQAATYLEGVRELGLGGDDAAFVFVVQAKEPPYPVSVVELDPLALRIGRHANRKAVDLYLECRTADRWPAYSSDVELVSLPHWAEHEYEQETTA